MSNQTANSGDNCVQREFAGVGLRAGIAKDKLIFIIICSAALAVAVVSMVRFFTSSKYPDMTWQCLDCNARLTLEIEEFSPIECPKCDGEAVRVLYRNCPNCGKKVLYYRIRLTAEEQDKREARRAAGQPEPGPMTRRATELQYRVKQADGSFDWTPWIAVDTPEGQRQVRQFYDSLLCPNCDAPLF